MRRVWTQTALLITFIVGLHGHAQSAAPIRTQSQLDGTWRLIEISIDRLTQAVGGSTIETERPLPETFFEESRTIEIVNDIVTVQRKGNPRFLPPRVTNDQYWLDGQPHPFQWGDIPGQTVGQDRPMVAGR
jgi:hypothetical protein